MSNTGDKYAVKLLDKVCDCRKWLLTGLPCCHAISCMKYKNYKIVDYVPLIFKKEQYAACYSNIIFLVNGQDLWMRTNCIDLQPPLVKRQPGRPKKKRRLDASELMRDNSQMKRASYGIKCSRCKQTRHNKSTCPLPPPPTPSETQATSQTQAQSSQPQAQQSQAQQSQPQASHPQAQSSQPPIQKKKRSHRKRKNVDQVAATQPTQAKKKGNKVSKKAGSASQP